MQVYGQAGAFAGFQRRARKRCEGDATVRALVRGPLSTWSLLELIFARKLRLTGMDSLNDLMTLQDAGGSSDDDDDQESGEDDSDAGGAEDE